MEGSKLKIGNTVMLKSGGPDMKVEKLLLEHDNLVHATCSWTDDNNEIQHSTFREKVLVLKD